MSVPTHNLYDFIHTKLKRQFWVHYFFPWGYKDLDNIIPINYRNKLEDSFDYNSIVAYKILPKSFVTEPDIAQLQPFLLCHDQEPLFFDLYNDQNISDYIEKKCKDIDVNLPVYNLRWRRLGNLQKYWILLHSELFSEEVEKYENTGRFIGAYWWSHAMIARDWYRYAQWDPTLQHNPEKNTLKTFLIYSREDSGTRKFRKTFKDQLVDLQSDCQFSSFYKDNITGDSSASYDSYDFVHTDFSVILETIYDDRIHLTEKTLRPIACGHPFWLLSGPGVLKYLKTYGFKTFSPWIDETYDEIQNAKSRMDCLVQSMYDYNRKTPEQKQTIKEHCYKIAEHNKKVFFSNSFAEQIVKELIDNVTEAYKKTNNEIALDDFVEIQRAKDRIRPNRKENQYLQDDLYIYLKMFQDHINKGGTLENYVPPDSK